MTIPIIPIIGPIVGIVSDWLEGRRELKKVKAEGEIQVVKAKTTAAVRFAETAQSQSHEWNKLSIENSGWKDEFWTLVLAAPFILCFIPGGAAYVKAGFTALNESTPEWYQLALLIALGSAFGVRELMKFMDRRK